MTEDHNMGGFIAAMRKEKGLTQQQLADQLGVTDKAVSKWERGAGCPEISLLTRLAGCLGVSVEELLKGARHETPSPASPLPASVQPQALPVEPEPQFVHKDHSGRWRGILHLLAALLTGGCLLAAAICMICDYALNRAFTWSIYPVSSLVLAWLVLMPALLVRKRRFAASLVVLSLALLPYLGVLAHSVNGGWFFPVAVPVSLAGLCSLWLGYLCFHFTGGNGLLLGAMALVLVPAVDFVVSIALWRYLHDPLFDLFDLPKYLLCFASAGLLLLFVRTRRSKTAQS